MHILFLKVKNLLTEHRKKGSFYLILSAGISKIFSFVINIQLATYLSVADFGITGYLLGLLAILSPFAGWGLHKAYLRYASVYKEKEKIYFTWALTWGVIFNVLIFTLFLTIIYLFNQSVLQEALPYLPFLILPFLALYFYELSQNTCLIKKKIKQYATMESIRLALVAVAIFLLATYLSVTLYLLLFSFFTLLCSVYVLKKMKHIRLPRNDLWKDKPFLRYGRNSSFAGIISQIMYSADILMIGYLLQNSEQIALYKAGIMLPLSFTFISLALVNTRYTEVSENYQNAIFLQKVSRNITYTAFAISMLLYLILFLYKETFITFFFGDNYQEAISVYIPALFTMIVALTFRVPYGNLLAAIGKTHWNFYISLSILILNLCLNYWWINTMGIYGAALATLMATSAGGIISWILWKIYLKKIK